MSLPLIRPEQDFAIWAVLIGLAGFGFWCERFPWGRKYSGVILLITAAIVLANLRIIPTAAPVYDVVWDYLVPIAIPLLLFHADLKRIFKEPARRSSHLLSAAHPWLRVYSSVNHFLILVLMKQNSPGFSPAPTSGVD